MRLFVYIISARETPHYFKRESVYLKFVFFFWLLLEHLFSKKVKLWRQRVSFERESLRPR